MHKFCPSEALNFSFQPHHEMFPAANQSLGVPVRLAIYISLHTDIIASLTATYSFFEFQDLLFLPSFCQGCSASSHKEKNSNGEERRREGRANA